MSHIKIADLAEARETKDKIEKLVESKKIKDIAKAKGEPEKKINIKLPIIKVSKSKSNNNDNGGYNPEYVYREYAKSLKDIVIEALNLTTYKDDKFKESLRNSKDFCHSIDSVSDIGFITNDYIGFALSLGSICLQHSLERQLLR